MEIPHRIGRNFNSIRLLKDLWKAHTKTGGIKKKNLSLKFKETLTNLQYVFVIDKSFIPMPIYSTTFDLSIHRAIKLL